MRQKQSGVHHFRFRRLTHTAGDLKLTLAVAVWLCACICLFLPTNTNTSSTAERAKLFDYRCFHDKKDLVATTFNLHQTHIGLQVSDHVTNQLISRIFAIFMREKLNYQNITIIPFKYSGRLNDSKFEAGKLLYTLNLIKYHEDWKDLSMINLGVWMSPVGHTVIPKTLYEAGSSITSGRFGWFVPMPQHSANSTREELHFSIFVNTDDVNYKRFVLRNEDFKTIRNLKDTEEFISPNCRNRVEPCVTLLAQYRYDTAFVVEQILETNAFVNILWLGANFREKVLWFYEVYQRNPNYYQNNFIVLHWTPSDLINPYGKLTQLGASECKVSKPHVRREIKFQQIIMPHCEELKSLEKSICKYEFTPILKYYSKSLSSEANARLMESLRDFFLVDDALVELQLDLSCERAISSNTAVAVDDVYNAVACRWLKRNPHIYSKWNSEGPKITLAIGGIFPITETSRGHKNLVKATRRAVEAINSNSTVLPNYNITVLENDGQCKADLVMKAFIHYFNEPRLLGVLGPACSETVEPIAGISKHMDMAVISYSAEGASFLDRKAYPFFFRTIGSNRQYEDAYIRLMKHFGWRRVAALTEDGQKYTEYISHMEATMKQQNLELILNKKFLSSVSAGEMNKHLLDLKKRHAKIIIADIHTRNAELALCEAYKLGMTAHEGYVWFLPAWLSKNWNMMSSGHNDSCTSRELEIAFEGHLSIMHAPYGAANATMQENMSIGKWLQTYKKDNESISDYTGFAYDAVWAYALAVDKLLRENGDAVNNLRTKSVGDRFVELIWETDFEGLSGRVRFGQGGSRITELNIMQWHKGEFVQMGKFEPVIIGEGTDLRTESGHLKINDTAIHWLTGGNQPPGDGTYDCSFSGLAEILGIDCDSAAVLFTAIMCVLAVVIVSLVSFLFWKQRYDTKLRKSAKLMKNFGIDLLSPSNNSYTLDKWEVPKEHVVINRRLGEGAFGTVYGGEVQLKSQGGWTAVAVKTLKAGASTEDRLDFLSEADAIRRFDHKNIVKLIGVCLSSEPIYTIMEFMLYGDLKTYLLARRHLVNERTSDDSDISPKRLTMYAMDVARGLSYLAQQKYVHRDLACRNCLVNAHRVVKIGDFGMARPTFESDYYRFNRKGMLPVRWMAPESLALGMFTPSSDVWAFGVVVYEIITFGSFPYQGFTNNQVLEYVKGGNTLQIPNGVKPYLEGLIKACWSTESKKRPSAKEIVDYISNYPRLVTPCLDFPGASVQMPETESDELELLPKTRKCSPIKCDSPFYILAKNASNGNFECREVFEESLEMPEQNTITIPNETANRVPNGVDTFSLITPDGYSIMSPLLMHQVSECSDSSQVRLIKKASAETLQQTPF